MAYDPEAVEKYEKPLFTIYNSYIGATNLEEVLETDPFFRAFSELVSPKPELTAEVIEGVFRKWVSDLLKDEIETDESDVFEPRVDRLINDLKYKAIGSYIDFLKFLRKLGFPVKKAIEFLEDVCENMNAWNYKNYILKSEE